MKRIIITLLLCSSITLELFGCASEDININSIESNNEIDDKDVDDKSTIDTTDDKVDDVVDAVNQFVYLYNETSETPITELTDIDIHDKSGGYYRTEFRTYAFNDATAKHGTIGEETSLDLIKYSNGFRIYVTSNSYDELQKVLETSINIYNSSVTNDTIQTEVYDKIDSVGSGVSFYIDDITGYYEIINREVGICSVMLDTTSINFVE